MRGHRFTVIGLGALLALATVACSSNETNNTTIVQPTDTTTATSEPAAGEVGQLRMIDLSFQPSAVQAGEGGVLTVTNDDSVTHTFTMDDGSIDQQVESGESVDVVIGTAGSFHCEIHPSMTGTIESE